MKVLDEAEEKCAEIKPLQGDYGPLRKSPSLRTYLSTPLRKLSSRGSELPDWSRTSSKGPKLLSHTVPDVHVGGDCLNATLASFDSMVVSVSAWVVTATEVARSSCVNP
eukprot:2150782-Amphidinium_carterae.1